MKFEPTTSTISVYGSYHTLGEKGIFFEITTSQSAFGIANSLQIFVTTIFRSNGQLLSMRGCGQRHSMTPEDIHHLRTIRRAAAGGTDYFGSFTEVGWTHYRRGYDDELFYILAAEVIETVNCTAGDT